MILDLLATLVWKLNQRAERKRVAATGTFTVTYDK